MARSQVYKATQGSPLALKAPHDANAKLYYEFDYGATVDPDGNAIDPKVPSTSSITDSSWAIQPNTATIDNESYTVNSTRCRVTSVPASATEFTLTNHITILHQSGDIEEDERSILVTIAER
jgi:hypothetical protein